MLDIQFVRENPEKIQAAAQNKGIKINVHKIIEIDKNYRETLTTVQTLQGQVNSLSKTIKGKPTPEQIKEGKKLKEALQKKEAEVKLLKHELESWFSQLPNPAKEDVKVGKDESENDVIRKYKTPTKFAFTPKDHLELGEALGIIDMTRAAKVSGARFAYFKGEGVLLELALVQFALETLVKEGFTPVFPPVLIKREVMQGLGYMENGGDEDMFHLRDDDLILVGTAEHALVPMHKDEVLRKEDLPRRYVGYSPSFRREAGSYGKDTKGILRVHEFNKVEMVSFVAEGEDDAEHEFLLGLEEKFFQALDIPYQVVKMCTGDLGFPAARKYDIEAWMPGQNKYREVTSVSTVTDFQSRRLNMKYQDGNEKKYLNVLNGTAFAMSRTPIVILENYQQADGSVIIPEVLRKYMGKDIIKPR
ncbi:MAG TPA: serine--tRNA ligase [Patescibacteria group bacterium]